MWESALAALVVGIAAFFTVRSLVRVFRGEAKGDCAGGCAGCSRKVSRERTGIEEELAGSSHSKQPRRSE